MRFNVGDKFLLCDIECTVALVNAKGSAYLVPEVSGEAYNNGYTLTGCVFAIVDEKGKDKLGNRVICVSNQACGAV